MILAIDTSTVQASVALAEPSGVRAECTWYSGRNQSTQLTTVIRNMLGLAGISASFLTAVCVATGPGSFSGVRIGMSEAKGLALGLDVPLVGVSTLDVIGFQASAHGGSVAAVMDAGRGQFFVAAYAGSTEKWKQTQDHRLLSLDEAVSLAAEVDLVAGDGADAVAQMLLEDGKQIHVETSPWRVRRAAFLAELGMRYLKERGPDPLHQLEPLYLRRSAAEENVETRSER